MLQTLKKKEDSEEKKSINTLNSDFKGEQPADEEQEHQSRKKTSKKTSQQPSKKNKKNKKANQQQDQQEAQSTAQSEQPHEKELHRRKDQGNMVAAQQVPIVAKLTQHFEGSSSKHISELNKLEHHSELSKMPKNRHIESSHQQAQNRSEIH